MNNILQNAQDKKYTDFSNAVKQELKTKLSQRDEVKTFVSDFEKIQAMKQMFNQINTDFGSAEEE